MRCGTTRETRKCGAPQVWDTRYERVEVTVEHRHSQGLTMKNRSGRLAGLACALVALALFTQTQSIAAPASALGPEVSVAGPRDGFVGRLNVAPENGPVGTPLTVTADRLPPNQEFQLVWRTVKGNWKVGNAEYHGRDYKEVAYEI